MQFGHVVDRLVSKAAHLPQWQRSLIRPMLYPLIIWRIRNCAHILATQYEWLPQTSWTSVEKHGYNVVYSTTPTGKEVIVGVVDYKNHTARRVSGVPTEFHKAGATF